MEGLLDRTSPRRGSLNSLHRQSSGSSTQNSKFAQSSSHHQVTNNSNNTGSSASATQSPDIDRYTRYFILKAVQIIVQSRVGGIKELRSECKPNGNDWFNINLTDVAEISKRTKTAIDQEGLSMKSNWRVCCEISLKMEDGSRVVLEQWIITNRSISLVAPPNSAAGSPSANNSKYTENNIKIAQLQNSVPNMNNVSPNSNITSTNQSQQQASNASPPSIYTIYNRMTLLLKTLMTTAHIVPAFRLASKVNYPNVICYRVYTEASSSSCQNLAGTGLPSPLKNEINPSNVNRSVDLPLHVDGASDDGDQHFGPIFKLGSIKTDANELSICYRTDVSSSNHLLGSPKAYDKSRANRNQTRFAGTIQDEDYLMAAKQLLSGYSNHTNQDQRRNSIENLDSLDQPLAPAFASRVAATPPKTTNLADNNENDSENSNNLYGELIESAFEGLLNNNGGDMEGNKGLTSDSADTTMNSTKHRNGCERSANIQVPAPNNNQYGGRRGPRSNTNSGANQPSSGSTPKSLSDSFVFVDINPPFASEEQNDINSFFHGPSPSFSNGFDSLKDVDELTNQLATIEANAQQIDLFVDNICSYEDEEEDETGEK